MASSPKDRPQDPTKRGEADGSALANDTFDVFSGNSDRDAMWIESVVGIDQARARMQEIAESEPGRYFIFYARSGRVIVRIETKPQDKKAKSNSEVA